tara:strand:+ start:5082 stop:5216 length:135 start_codon:yes stop_codon:yes gene_type:complete
LLKQAGGAIPKAVNDGDMTTEDATPLCLIPSVQKLATIADGGIE